jgi:hypothetical protein
MNRPIQPDIHPDADSLNAFVERVLPDAERARILEHMAGCVRCREVVYLAREAAGVEAGPSPVEEAKSRQRRGWLSPFFNGWRIAWIPAAALAAVGAVLVWVHPRTARMSVNRAQVSVPSAPASNAPPPSPETARSVASPPAIESGARRLEMTSKPAAAASHEQASAIASQQVTVQAGQSTLTELRAGSNPVPMTPAAQPQPAMSAPAQVVSQPPPTSTQEQQPQPHELTDMTESRAMSAAKLARAPAPPGMIAVHGGVMAPTADRSSQDVAEAEAQPQPAAMPQTLDGLAVLRLTRRLKLPSGLNAVSSAGTPGRLLAVDPAGAVFLSVDAGKHWDPVQTQWTGKAIELHAEQQAVHQPANPGGPVRPAPAGPPLDETSSVPPPAASVVIEPATVQATPLAPAVLFRLVNDRHQTWMSTDGKTWHPQPQ